MRRVASAAALALGLAAVSAPAAPPRPRVKAPLLRPVALFAQHLYEGDFAEPRGIAVDRARGEVWVADTRNSLLGVFTAEGVPLYTTARTPRINQPARLAVAPDGKVLVLDSDRSRIKVLDYRGEYVADLELPGLREKPVFGALCFDAAGNLHVADNATAQVLVYDAERKLRLRFGERGGEEGQFLSINGIFADERYIYVVDARGLAVQLFDRNGRFVRGWGRHDMGVANVSLPQGVAVDAKGRVIVVDALRHEIKFYDQEGTFLDRFGGLGSGVGEISYPSDVAVDAQDRVYVVEKGNDRVTVFEEVERAAAR